MAVTAVVFSPDGALLAAAGFDENVTIYDLGKPKQDLILAMRFIVSGLAFSADGSRLAVAGYSTAPEPLPRAPLRLSPCALRWDTPA